MGELTESVIYHFLALTRDVGDSRQDGTSKRRARGERSEICVAFALSVCGSRKVVGTGGETPDLESVHVCRYARELCASYHRCCPNCFLCLCSHPPQTLGNPQITFSYATAAHAKKNQKKQNGRRVLRSLERPTQQLAPEHESYAVRINKTKTVTREARAEKTTKKTYQRQTKTANCGTYATAKYFGKTAKPEIIENRQNRSGMVSMTEHAKSELWRNERMNETRAKKKKRKLSIGGVTHVQRFKL